MVLAGVLLAIGLGLNLWALAQWALRERPTAPESSPITDPAELGNLRRELSGTYATGSESGSRMITVRAEDRVDLALLAADASGALRPVRRLGYDFAWSRRRDGTICLVTNERLQVVVGPDAGTLLLSGDRYTRQQLAKAR